MKIRDLSLEEYFIRTGFYDLLPLATQIAQSLRFSQEEMIEGVCKVYDKFCRYPPTRNRTAWFGLVFKEKLYEARGDLLSFRSQK
ncbi:MAG: hypothetical protein GX434_15000 [Peptococcaceae bacterium]|nr:hypothetical protein [Peptococcaceae bacterium]